MDPKLEMNINDKKLYNKNNKIITLIDNDRIIVSDDKSSLR